MISLAPAAAAKIDAPFKPGERLDYVVKWNFLPAGNASLEVRQFGQFNNSKVYHFVMTVTTNSFVDMLNSVRDRYESLVDIEMTHSLLYRRLNMGKRKKDITVVFDWEKNEARFSNFGEAMEPITLLPGSFDPLSVFYAFRLIDLTGKKLIETPVSDGKKAVMGRTTVVRKEQIEVEGRSYDTVLVKPSLEHFGGVFKKSKDPNLEIWFTADRRRIPVRMKVKVSVGSIIFDYVDPEGS